MFTPTYFTAESFPNSHIIFDSEGIILRVSLNIEKKMIPYLSINNVFKGKNYLVYSLSKRIENVSYLGLKHVYDLLMSRAMINCREAKCEILKKEIKQLRLNFK